MVTFNPRASSRVANDAAVIPLPSDDTTPPVTNMYRVMQPPLFLGQASYLALRKTPNQPMNHWLGYHNKNKELIDRKSTRLNSSHVAISYAVVSSKKKNDTHE